MRSPALGADDDTATIGPAVARSWALRAAGALVYAGLAYLDLASRPGFGSRPGNAEVLGEPNNRPALVNNESREQQTPAGAKRQ